MMVASETPYRGRGGLHVVHVVGAAIGVVGVMAVAFGEIGSPGLAAPILVAGIADRHNIGVLLGWIAAGALLLGGAIYGLTTFVDVPLATPLAVGFGGAVGGGLAGSLRLLANGEATGRDSTETMTVDMDENGAAQAPEPRPADLFEASPDPLVYYDDSGEGPIVLAVNPAFEGTFGIGAEAVENAALADAIVGDVDTDDVRRAATAGEADRRRVTCDTDAGPREFLLRLVPLSVGTGARGYAVYTPLEDDRGAESAG